VGAAARRVDRPHARSTPHIAPVAHIVDRPPWRPLQAARARAPRAAGGGLGRADAAGGRAHLAEEGLFADAAERDLLDGDTLLHVAVHRRLEDLAVAALSQLRGLDDLVRWRLADESVLRLLVGGCVGGGGGLGREGLGEDAADLHPERAAAGAAIGGAAARGRRRDAD
jgi:hypothetical protein